MVLVYIYICTRIHTSLSLSIYLLSLSLFPFLLFQERACPLPSSQRGVGGAGRVARGPRQRCGEEVVEGVRRMLGMGRQRTISRTSGTRVSTKNLDLVGHAVLPRALQSKPALRMGPFRKGTLASFGSGHP